MSNLTVCVALAVFFCVSGCSTVAAKKSYKPSSSDIATPKENVSSYSDYLSRITGPLWDPYTYNDGDVIYLLRSYRVAKREDGVEVWERLPGPEIGKEPELIPLSTRIPID